MFPLKQGIAITMPFFVHDAAGDAVTGLTNASFTKRISKGSGAWAAMTVIITEMENGWYSFPLSTDHSDTLGVLSVTFTNAGAKQVNLQWRVSVSLQDDTYSAISNLANVGSATNTSATAYVLTTGVQSLGTFASTVALDGANHEHTDTTGAMDLYYEFNIGGGTPSSVKVTGYLNGNNDDLEVYGYDWATTAWVQIGTLAGKASSTNEVNEYDLFANMVGTGANRGLVRVRFTDGAFTLTTATLAIDQIFVSYSAASVGYDGFIWFDSTASNTNTVPNVDGTSSNPVSSEAAVVTLSANLNINRVKVAPGSTYDLASTYNNYFFDGDGIWTLTLGGQDVGGTTFKGAKVSGIGTGSTEISFIDGEIGIATIHPFHAHNIALTGILSLGAAGNYVVAESHSGIAGSTTPIIDMGASIGNVNLTMPGYDQGVEIRNLNSTGVDLFSISGQGQIIYAASSSGAVNQRGEWKETNIGGVIITRDDSAAQVWDEVLSKSTHNVSNSAGRRLREMASYVIRADTAQGPGTGNNQIQLDAAASAVDGAYDPSMVAIIDGTGPGQTRLILEYDGTTKTATVDRNWKVNPDATSEFVILAHPGREHVNEGLAQAGGTNTITLNALASAVDNAYLAQVVFIRSGTGEDQSGTIIAYNGTTKVATIDKAWATAPDGTSAYIMIPNDHVILAAVTHTGAVIPGIPVGITKNAAFDDMEFLMVLTSDHVTPATGLVVTGQRSINGAAFVNVAGVIAEVGSGIYQFDAQAADTNGDVITYRFSSGTADDTFVTVQTTP